MPKGYPLSRTQNLDSTTREAKRVLLQTRDWDKTKTHLNYWIRGQWGFSRMTINDYMGGAAARLMKDAETKELLK